MRDPIRVFIGYDPREAIAYHVCQQSIIDHAADPLRLEFHPVCGERRDGSNDFIYARFLVPWLCGFKGSAIFLDGDMIVRDDLTQLAAMLRLDMGVQCVQHDYKTKYPTKYLGNKNEDYPRKNWSSVMLWNCGFLPNRVLTPKYVGNATGSFLHRFGWLSDRQIGALSSEWNHLCMEYEPNPEAKLYHYTIGAPCFQEYIDQEGGAEWYRTLDNAMAPLCRP